MRCVTTFKALPVFIYTEKTLIRLMRQSPKSPAEFAGSQWNIPLCKQRHVFMVSHSDERISIQSIVTVSRVDILSVLLALAKISSDSSKRN